MPDQSYFPPAFDCLPSGVRLDLRARIALDIIHHIGIATAIEDGEDSAGRARLRIQRPDEIVDRAVDMAEIFVRVCEEKGWIEATPTEPAAVAQVVADYEALKWKAGRGLRRAERGDMGALLQRYAGEERPGDSTTTSTD